MAPSTKLRPRKFYRRDACSSGCSMSVARLGDERASLVHGWFEAGKNNKEIVALSNEAGFHLSEGAIGRHRKNHLGVVEDAASQQPDAPAPKVNHLDLLEKMIAQGARNMALPGTRISPEMALRAMEMHYKLTQGSAMDQLLEAVTGAMSGESEDDAEYMTAIEAAEARLSIEEKSQGELVGAEPAG